MCNISHLLSCKLLRKFISWVSKNTKMPNCIGFFAVPITAETAMEALPLLFFTTKNLKKNSKFAGKSLCWGPFIVKLQHVIAYKR